MYTKEEFAQRFDLAYLSPNLQKKDIDEAIAIAAKYNVSTMNVNSHWVAYANKEFEKLGAKVRASAVIGFPYGACTLDTKLFEIEQMVQAGASALDMVINIGEAKDENWEYIRKEVRAFVEASKGIPTKLIFEVAFLSIPQIEEITRIACEEGIDFVKTATGTQEFPDLEDVQAMQRNLSGNTKIKVSGVPRTFSLAAALFLFENYDVELVGTRSAGKIVEQYEEYKSTRVQEYKE